MKCYKCGRTWKFDGSREQDNRCFSCEPNGIRNIYNINIPPVDDNTHRKQGLGGWFWIISMILLFTAPPVGVIMIFIAVINEP